MQTPNTTYKNTEIGTIPVDWEVKKMGEVTDITRLAGYEYSTLWEETSDGEIIALRGFNIGKNKIIERETVRISNKLSMRLIRSQLFKGDVVYPCVGTIGNAVVIEEDNKFHIQQNIAKISPCRKLSSYFLAHYLMSDLGLREIEKFNGSSSQPNILVGSLRKYAIIIPTLTEQTAIANALSDADALINNVEKLITKKRNIKQGAMQKLLEPKEGWEVKKLGEIGEFKNGINKGGEDFGFGYPFVNLLDVFGKTKISDNSHLGLINSNEMDRRMYELRKGDVLFIRSSVKPEGVGLTCIIDENLENTVFSGFIIRFRDNGLLSKEFKEYCFSSQHFRNRVIAGSSVSANTNINQDTLKNLILHFPKSKETQIKIAQILSDMDLEIAGLEGKLSKYRAIKTGMMQQLLTGKIRLVV